MTKSRTAGARVLVVDAELSELRLMQLLLRRLGHQPVLAGCVADAASEVAAARPDLVLMDVRTASADDFDAVRAIRSALGDDAPCIVGLSAGAQRRRVDAPSPFDGVIAKPLDLGTIAERLDTFLPDGKRSRPLFSLRRSRS